MLSCGKGKDMWVFVFSVNNPKKLNKRDSFLPWNHSSNKPIQKSSASIISINQALISAEYRLEAIQGSNQ
jgi:hypothetical protein